MKEATFLKYFEQHTRFFLSKKVITKTEILYNLDHCDCPFYSKKGIVLDEWEAPPLGLTGTSYLAKNRNKIVHRWHAETTFKRNMQYEWMKPDILKAMVKIVKGIK